jgi:hypothetical protein
MKAREATLSDFFGEESLAMTHSFNLGKGYVSHDLALTTLYMGNTGRRDAESMPLGLAITTIASSIASTLMMFAAPLRTKEGRVVT